MTAAAIDQLPDDPADAERGPGRRCIVTRAILDKDLLLRCVVDPDGRLVADLEGRLPGRGLWITPQRALLDQALAQRLFAKAARGPVTVGADFIDRLEAGLRRRLTDQLGLARRAGAVVMGFDAVRAALAEHDGGRAYHGLLIAASDAADNGRDKLRQLARRAERLDLLTSAALSQALGRPDLIHAAIPDARFTARICATRDRLISLFPQAGSAKPVRDREENQST